MSPTEEVVSLVEEVVTPIEEDEGVIPTKGHPLELFARPRSPKSNRVVAGMS